MTTRIGFTSLLIALGLGAGYGASHMRPVLYESTAVVQVVPASVTTTVLMDPANLPHTEPLEQRLRAGSQTILTRTRLEGLIREYGLFKHERENLIMQDVVELMRRRVDLRPSDGVPAKITVSFADPDRVSAMNVAARLTTFIIDESLRESARRSENTASFLESQAEESRRELEEAEHAGRGGVSVAKRTELEVLQSRYKSLLIKRADAQTLVNLGLRQIGERFTLIEPAQLPERPLSPTRLEFTLAGGAAGLAVAVVFMLIGFVRRLGRDRQGVFSPTTA
jgi:uncharacterized protein involved in exopolysaccharide biosynthesis